MGQIIKLTTDNTMEVVDISFDVGDSSFNRKIHELIGNNCSIYETVPPRLVNTLTRNEIYPNKHNPIGVIMLIDEEGKLKNNKTNFLATVLTDFSFGDIVGNAIIIGTEKKSNGEIDFCPLPPFIINVIQRVCNIAIREMGSLQKYDVAINSGESGYQCIACVKLNKENGGTLPLFCPKFNNPCVMLNKDTKTPEQLNDISNEISASFLEKSFNKCWDDGNLSDLFEEMKEMMSNASEKDIRMDMCNSTVFDTDLINKSLSNWDFLIRKNNKDIYKYDRY